MRNGHVESYRDMINARMRPETCSEKGILNLKNNSGPSFFLKTLSAVY